MPYINCEVCDKSFYRRPGQINKSNNFCSKECFSKHSRALTPEGDRRCVNCNICFRTNPAYIKRRTRAGIYCSKKCHLDFVRKHPKKGIDVHGYSIIGCKKEHRVAMESFLGFELNPEIHVHHINGIKTDNRIENLTLMTHSQHNSYHSQKMAEKRRNGRNLKCVTCGKEKYYSINQIVRKRKFYQCSSCYYSSGGARGRRMT